MKFNKSIYLSIGIYFLALACFSCGTSSSDNQKQADEEVVNFQEADPIIKAYLDLKDNLVETNAKKAQKSAGEFIETLKDAKGQRVELMRNAAENITKTTDVEIQRVNFEEISDNIFIYAQDNDMGIKLYRQHCPMAFKNKGASWLSAERKIMNPYFGDKMLHCGTVEDEL